MPSAIRQRRMRSESDGHCYPRSFPGLAPREAARTLSLGPLLQTVCNRYRPTVEEFLRHVEELRDRSGWDASIVRQRVQKVEAVDGGFESTDRSSSGMCSSRPDTPGSPCRPSWRTTRARCTRTSPTSTPSTSRSWEPVWPQQPSG